MVPPLGARGLAYIALYEAPQPSDQTDLDERLLLIIKGDRGMIHEVAPDWPPRWGGCPGGGAPAPVTLTGGSHFLWDCFSSLLDYSFIYISLYVNMTCGPHLVIS
jgi:hypothetical protein